MKKQFLWAALAIAVSAATPLITTQPADSAIPPLSSQQLQERSTHIVIGEVIRIFTQDVVVKYGTDYQHTANIRVESIERPRSTSLKPGQTIDISYTTIKDRQSGWTGSQRQSQPLDIGIKVKLFLVEQQPGKFSLLEPNGWQPHPLPTKAPRPQSPLNSQENPPYHNSQRFHPQTIKSFITDIRTAATHRDAKTLVSFVRFPLTLYEMGQPLITYHQPEALMRDFSLVFTNPILTELQQASDTKLFINGNGAMIGNGAVWFDEREDGIKIKAINGDRKPLKARF